MYSIYRIQCNTPPIHQQNSALSIICETLAVQKLNADFITHNIKMWAHLHIVPLLGGKIYRAKGAKKMFT